MRVKDLEGNSYSWSLEGYTVDEDKRPRSEFHLTARELISRLFPTLQILEEVPIKINRGSTQYLDFYLPMRKVCIEVHGQQHYSYNSLFHSGPMGFVHQKKLDRQKIEWCDINGIGYIELKYSEQDGWEEQLTSGV